MKNKLFENFIYLIIFLSFLYLFICFFMYFFQRDFLYLHKVHSYNTVYKLNADIQKIDIPSTDNIQLKSWFYKNEKNKYTLLFLHGNGDTKDARIYKLNTFKNLNLNYLIISWRGYEGSKGKPSEQGLYDDANSAVKWLEANNIPKNKIIIYGESLGTGVAIEIAQKKKFAGIILESPYTSLIDIAKINYSYLPVNLILKDKYDSINKIKNISSPVLVMHGEKDRIVPNFMGKAIFDKITTKKQGYFPEKQTHFMRYDEELILEIKKFVKNLN